jgi:hypothetical protein
MFKHMDANDTVKDLVPEGQMFSITTDELGSGAGLFKALFCDDEPPQGDIDPDDLAKSAPSRSKEPCRTTAKLEAILPHHPSRTLGVDLSKDRSTAILCNQGIPEVTFFKIPRHVRCDVPVEANELFKLIARSSLDQVGHLLVFILK